jgi:putative exosortase-associated protein (TIGR04073 family)
MKIVAVATLVIAVAAAASTASAAMDMKMDLEKLHRGMTNAMACWVEMGYQPKVEMDQSGAAKGIPVGIGKGFLMTGYRFGSGLIDTFTFPFSWPEESLVQPAYNPWIEAPAQAAPKSK